MIHLEEVDQAGHGGFHFEFAADCGKVGDGIDNDNAGLELINQVSIKTLPPKCSWYFEVNSGFGTVNWYGRGQFETYPDRKEGLNLSLYKSNATDFNIQRVRPQEMSNKTDTRWLDLSTFEGYHICGIGLPLMDANVLPYPYDELDGKYLYGVDLKPGKVNSVILGSEIWPMNESLLEDIKWPLNKTLKAEIRLKAYKADQYQAFQFLLTSLP